MWHLVYSMLMLGGGTLVCFIAKYDSLGHGSQPPAWLCVNDGEKWACCRSFQNNCRTEDRKQKKKKKPVQQKSQNWSECLAKFLENHMSIALCT